MDKEPRINERIRVPEVRLIDANGEQIGLTPLAEALGRAREQDLDLVEVAPNARPPVCRIMDYGRFKYQQAVKAKEARKRQSQIVMKEMKMRPKIDRHDYATKLRHVERFLREGSKVKATIMFRGREMTHTELGLRLLDRLAEDLGHLGHIETAPSQDGRTMTMVLAPHKTGPRDDGRAELSPDGRATGQRRARRVTAADGAQSAIGDT
ncbi:MAG: translation initiation factor IF-3 [Actinomycetota bacterium]|nr:translation initiation factor IF-3 [Actinomycetota bacterium]